MTRQTMAGAASKPGAGDQKIVTLPRQIINLETGSLGEIGTSRLEARLATSPQDIEACQRLRYQVFYEECGAQPVDDDMARLRLDYDPFDKYCDHVMVVQKGVKDVFEATVGTYRLLRREGARKAGRFYSQSEYDIERLLHVDGELMELGRSAVHESFRSFYTMQLLWRGLAAYIAHYDVKLMFGCTSFEGVDAEALKLPLSYLYHFHLAPPALRARTIEGHYVDMNMMPADDIDVKKAIAELPPLMKGYLRVGVAVGDGAFVDEQFNTVDVLTVVQTAQVTERYLNKYLGSYDDA